MPSGSGLEGSGRNIQCPLPWNRHLDFRQDVPASNRAHGIRKDCHSRLWPSRRVLQSEALVCIEGRHLHVQRESSPVDVRLQIQGSGHWRICWKAVEPRFHRAVRRYQSRERLNGGSDWRTDIDEAYALESICNKRGIPCRLQIVPDVGNDLEDQRGDVIVGLLGSLNR